MKKFVLNTKSESGDNYTYFIESAKKPSDAQIKNFLKTHGNDIDEEDGTIYEHTEALIEIPNTFTKI